MKHILFYVLPVLTLAWGIWGAAEYRRLKLALQAGRREAVLREYRQTVAGELIFGALSLLAVGRAILRPAPVFRIPLPPDTQALLIPILIGLFLGSVVVIVALRFGHRPPQIGDFDALMPQSTQERWLYAAVAISAGVCEELLFRGFGLRLFAALGLSGWPLLLIAAVAFGLIHFYQGAAGIAATTLVGALLAFLYIATGSLLVPIVVHTLIDLRPLAAPINRPGNAPAP